MKKRDMMLDYIDELANTGRGIETNLKGGQKTVAGRDAFLRCVKLIKDMKDSGKKAVFIGNGGSAAVASHQAVDYWKNGRIKAMAFNDVPQMSCLGNDFGYEYVFQKPVEMFCDKGDVLFAISSSGKSPNILNAVRSAVRKKLKVITLSGFSPKNPLRRLGDVNFYVPSSSYGMVEITHLLICHSILDFMIEPKYENYKKYF